MAMKGIGMAKFAPVKLRTQLIRRRIITHIAVLNLVMLVAVLVILPKYFENSIAWFSFFALYLWLMLVFVNSLLHYKNSLCEIQCNSESISFPRILFPKHARTLQIREITSADFFGKNAGEMLVIGIRNRYPKFIELSQCEAGEELVSLQRYLNEQIEKQDGVREKRQFRELVNEQAEIVYKDYGILLFCLVLISFYILTTGAFSDAKVLSDNVIAIGANTRAIISDLEIYRIFSSFVLHYNEAHLVFNLVLFFFLGQSFARIFGCVRAINVILLSSIAGVMVSNISMAYEASFGASGGGFGLIGAYTFAKVRHQDYLPAMMNQMPFWVLFLIIAVEVISGYYIEVIDLYNHAGGFIAGFLLMFATCHNKESLISEPKIIEKVAFFLLLASYIWGISHFINLMYS